MLTISHIYGHGFDAAQVERLKSLGFAFRERVSSFAGTQILRFIDFPSGPSLEVIDVEDDQAYLDFLPAGMAPYCPGVSMAVPSGSAPKIPAYQEKYRAWGTNTRHVNYDGSDTPGKPGWNFLNFDQPVIQGTFVYLTQHEAPAPEKPAPGEHINGVTHVAGLIFDLKAASLANLAQLAEVEIVSGQMDLGNTRVWAAPSAPVELPIREKKFPLAAALLKAANLDYFEGRPDIEIIEFQSRPAVYIQTTDHSWDLIITN